MNDSSSQRNWFPVILAGLTILLAVIFYGKYHPTALGGLSSLPPAMGGPRGAVAVQTAPAVTDTMYQSAVVSVMAAYRTSKNAQAAYDALVLLHVPSSMQQTHIDLIIAFGKLVSGDSADGQARLSAIAAQNSWLAL